MTQQRVYFNSRDKLIRLDIQKIVYFEGDGNYTYIVTANKQKVCVTMNLSHTEEGSGCPIGRQRQTVYAYRKAIHRKHELYLSGRYSKTNFDAFRLRAFPIPNARVKGSIENSKGTCYSN